MLFCCVIGRPFLRNYFWGLLQLVGLFVDVGRNERLVTLIQEYLKMTSHNVSEASF